ncbi:unnamed protein product [Cunninghamella echinulata]
MIIISTLSKVSKGVFYGVGLFGLGGVFHFLQIPSLIVGPFSPSLLIQINSFIVGTVWKTMQYVFEKRKQGKITFSGDHIHDHDSALIISNHRSWSDYYMIHSIALRRKMLDNCKYFVKDSIKWLPFFGWGMWLAGFVFVKRNWLQDQTKINKAFASIKKYNTPAWIINYVEGSRCTPQKLALCQSFARDHGYTVTENVLLPRTRGFITCVQQFRRSHIKYIYDFTIAYRHKKQNAPFNEAPNLIRIHIDTLSPEYQFHVHIRRYTIDELPMDEEELSKWLRDRFVEKDQILNKLKVQWTDGLEDTEVWEEPVWK